MLKTCRIFIAYDSENTKAMRKLRELLGGSGWSAHGIAETIWTDEGLQGGENWSAEIEGHIKTCDVAIVLLSARYLDRPYIKNRELPALEDRLKTPGVMGMFTLMDDCTWDTHPWIGKLSLVGGKSGQDPLKGLDGTDWDKRITEIAKEIFRQIVKTYERIWYCKSAVSLDAGNNVFVGRSVELQRLHDLFDKSEVAVVAVHGPAGYGKTALVSQWLRGIHESGRLADMNVLAWTFATASVGSWTSSAEFFDQAIAQFSPGGQARGYGTEGGGNKASDPQRALDLLDAIRRSSRNTLLILDSVDVLRQRKEQNGLRFDDPAMTPFLAEIAREGLRPGCKVVLTCRSLPLDIECPERRPSGPPSPGVARWCAPVAVPGMGREESRDLLYVSGVSSTSAPPQALDELLGGRHDYFDGNPFALVLYAGLVKKVGAGDPHLAGAIKDPRIQDPRLSDGESSVRIRKSSEWLEINQQHAFWFLRVLGLLHRPMTARIYNWLRSGGTPFGGGSKGFRELLPKYESAEFVKMIQALEEMQLVHRYSDDRWACHSMVRDWFAADFMKRDLDLWRWGHNILFERFQEAGRGKDPQSLDAKWLEPRYRAVIHGCLANHREEAFDLYWKDIHCGEAAYSTNYLGNHTRDLSALAGFFEQREDEVVDWGRPWHKLPDSITERATGVAAFCLHSVGLISDAIDARWAQIGTLARRAILAQCYQVDSLMVRGDLHAAQELAQHARNLGVGCDNLLSSGPGGPQRLWFETVEALSRLGAIWHMTGHCEKARVDFEQAKEFLGNHKEKKWTGIGTPEGVGESRGVTGGPPPGLYSLPGSRYWDFLLSTADSDAAVRDVQKEVSAVLAWFLGGGHELGPKGEPILWGLDIPLAHLALARIAGRLGDQGNAQREFDEAVKGIQVSWQVDQMPGALLARAQWEYEIGHLDAALADADAVLDIARRHKMALHEIDAHLMRADIYCSLGNVPDGRSALGQAQSFFDNRTDGLYMSAQVRLLLVGARLDMHDDQGGAGGMGSAACASRSREIKRTVDAAEGLVRQSGLLAYRRDIKRVKDEIDQIFGRVR